LKHSKGLSYLQLLLEQPGCALHVAALAGIEARTGDAGPVLDLQARAAYRARSEELTEELTEAEQFQDRARSERARAELEALAEQLAQAVGLGGRERRAASDVERLRINVQRRIKDAIDRIGAADPDLGRYLAATVKTGTTCVYQPL
jgi:non-specific serine/threonine protein kinase